MNVDGYGTAEVTEIATFNLKGSVLNVSPYITNPYATKNIESSYSVTGGSGSGLTISLSGNPSEIYSIKSYTITDNGSGYSIGDILSIPEIAKATITGITDSKISISMIQDSSYYSYDITGSYSFTNVNSKGSGLTISITTEGTEGYVCDTLDILDSGEGYNINDMITTPLGTYEIFSVSPGNKQGEVLSVSANFEKYFKTDMASDSIITTRGSGTGLVLSMTTISTTKGISYPGYVTKITQNLISTNKNFTFVWNLDNQYTIADTSTMTATIPYKNN